jgi:hypothetical protein
MIPPMALKSVEERRAEITADTSLDEAERSRLLHNLKTGRGVYRFRSFEEADEWAERWQAERWAAGIKPSVANAVGFLPWSARAS